jgi:hypothetical protein
MGEIGMDKQELIQDALETLDSASSIVENRLQNSSLDENEKGSISLVLMDLGTQKLKLEAELLRSVNSDFDEKKDELTAATSSLKSSLSDLEDGIGNIKVISDGIGLVTDIVKYFA